MTMASVFTFLLSLTPLLATAQRRITIGDGHLVLDTNEAAAIDFPSNTLDWRKLTNTASLVLDAWGVGIRKGNRIINDCATINGGDVGGEFPERINIDFERIRGKNGDETFDSRVVCGKQKAVAVRHQLRSAKRRNGCKGAYEMKVTVENRSCGTLPSVLYRRIVGVDVGGVDLTTIQGVKAKKPKVDTASSQRYCSPNPVEGPCDDDYPFPVPAFKQGPRDGGGDGGSTIQLDLGKLKKGQRATFYLYFGAFGSFRDAKKCVKGARIETQTLITDSETDDTVLFGIRRSLSKGKFMNKKKCVKL